MDLMTASTSYAKLQTKYQNFGAPTVRVHVDGVELVEKKDAKLSNITVDLTVEASASGCGFDVVCEYDAKNTVFSKKGASSLLQLGAKVELELGYIKTETVFYGLIVEVEYIFDDKDAPYIHVECMDAKCLLMKRQRLSLYSKKSLADAIGEMMGAQPFSDYVKGKKLEAPGDKLEMLPVAMEDDNQFIARYARYSGCEFFIAQGKVYFRKAPTSHSSIMTIGPDKGLMSIKQSLRGTALYKKATVVGINPADDKEISGEAAISGKFSGGSFASRMIGDSGKLHFDHQITSAEQAQARAKTLIQSAKGEFGRLECRCVGIPELVPGRSVTIEGISPDADKEHYILNVRHTLDERGFFTNLEARMDTL